MSVADTGFAAQQSLSGAGIIAAVKSAGVEYVLAVPDIHTASGLLMPLGRDPDLRVIRTCKEDECIGIAAGLSYGDRRALVLIQYTGFLYAMNAIRALAVEHGLPICMMVGLLNHTPGTDPRQSKRAGLRSIVPMLELLGIAHFLVEGDEHVGRIAPAICDAYEACHPVAILIGRSPGA
jgi:sulfopyruvate decarboxylase subunit alpha